MTLQVSRTTSLSANIVIKYVMKGGKTHFQSWFLVPVCTVQWWTQISSFEIETIVGNETHIEPHVFIQTSPKFHSFRTEMNAEIGTINAELQKSWWYTPFCDGPISSCLNPKSHFTARSNFSLWENYCTLSSHIYSIKSLQITRQKNRHCHSKMCYIFDR